MGKIFVNYRRDDGAASAARLRDRLAGAFGAARVFMDVDNLLAGQRFDKELEKALSETDVFLAVIGPRWLDILQARTASGERDYVREEIAGALAKGITVVPVLVERASLPRGDALPDDMRALVFHHKHDLTHERFGRDADDLITAIKAARKAAANPTRATQVPWGLVAATALGVAAVALVSAYQLWMPVGGPVRVELAPVAAPKPDPASRSGTDVATPQDKAREAAAAVRLAAESAAAKAQAQQRLAASKPEPDATVAAAAAPSSVAPAAKPQRARAPDGRMKVAVSGPADAELLLKFLRVDVRDRLIGAVFVPDQEAATASHQLVIDTVETFTTEGTGDAWCPYKLNVRVPYRFNDLLVGTKLAGASVTGTVCYNAPGAADQMERAAAEAAAKGVVTALKREIEATR